MNKLWEAFAFDVVSGRMPHTEQISGVRISDRSKQDFWIRIEVWLKFKDADKDPRGIEIKEFIKKEYIDRYSLPSEDIIPENHYTFSK